MEIQEEKDDNYDIEKGMELAFGEWEIEDICKMNWSVKRLSDYHISMSKYGGPIAMIPQRLNATSRLRIYNSCGEELWREPWQLLDEVIVMEWIDSEDLCVLLKNGTILLYNSSGTSSRQFSITEERVDFGTINGMSICVITKSLKILEIENLKDEDIKINTFPVLPEYLLEIINRGELRKMFLFPINKKISNCSRPLILIETPESKMKLVMSTLKEHIPINIVIK